MQTTCPQCGKLLTVSHQELALRDGMVVCPQCLKAYQAVEPGTLPPPVSHGQSAKPETPSKHYCPHCGQDIGHGINFCPYCGGGLHDNDVPDVQQPATSAAMAASAVAAVKKPGKSSHSLSLPSAEGSDAEFEWKPMIPSYRMERHHRHEPASVGFQAFAIAVILALLALLAFIIYHAILLQ